MNASTIRPGLIVVLSTTVTGNVHYEKRELGAKIDGDAEIVEWETTRTINDPKEFKAAGQVRMKARGLIWNACARSKFGLICPEDNEDRLLEAIKKAHDLADKFNAKAKMTSVNVNILMGRVASDDVEATKAINGEVRDLLDRMERGVKNFDVAAIRDAAKRAKDLSSIVAPGSNERLQEAIAVAREAASKLVKAGETAAKAVDKEALAKLKASRTAFLDIDLDGHSPDEIKVKPSKARARAVDLA